MAYNPIEIEPIGDTITVEKFAEIGVKIMEQYRYHTLHSYITPEEFMAKFIQEWMQNCGDGMNVNRFLKVLLALQDSKGRNPSDLVLSLYGPKPKCCECSRYVKEKHLCTRLQEQGDEWPHKGDFEDCCEHFETIKNGECK